jgi:TonB-dependent receptor
LRRFRNQRDRYGFNADLAFRPSQSHQFFLRGMVNKRADYQNRHQSRFRVDRGDYLSPTQVTGARLVRALQDRTETQIITHLAAGGQHAFDRWKADYTLAHTYGEQNKDAGQIIPEFTLNQNVDIDIDLSNPDVPGFTITNLPQSYLLDPANYVLNQIDFRHEFTSDQETIAALNVEYPFALGDHSASVKLGAKARVKRKDRNDERWRYTWQGAGDITMDMFASNEVEERFLDGAYVFGPTIDNGRIRSFFNQNRGGLLEEEPQIEDAVGDAYDASEGVYAYYGLARLQLGRWMLLGGLRHEITRTDYEGTRLMFDTTGTFVEAVPAADKRSYGNLFPTFHARFGVTDRTNLRFAFTSAIARANFFDLVPYLWVFPEDREILRGNSKLDPTYAYNFDLLLEHYFQGIGILSGGVFYKRLDDIIYLRTFVEQEGAFAGYDVEQPVNGGSAKLYGVELNWQQQFTFLPGFWNGFGIYANYTYSKSEADLLFREWTTLPGQASDAGNVALTYEGHRLDARVSLNFNGKFIDEVGASPAEDEIIDDHVQWDFSSSYAFSPRVGVYFTVVNLNNAPRRDYLGVTTRPRQIEYYSWWSTLGLKLRL